MRRRHRGQRAANSRFPPRPTTSPPLCRFPRPLQTSGSSSSSSPAPPTAGASFPPPMGSSSSSPAPPLLSPRPWAPAAAAAASWAAAAAQRLQQPGYIPLPTDYPHAMGFQHQQHPPSPAAHLRYHHQQPSQQLPQSRLFSIEDVQTLFGMQCKAVQESQSSFMRDNVQQLVALRPPVHQAAATPAGSVVPMSISASCCTPQQPSAPAQSAVPMSVSLATGCNNAPEQSNSCAGSPAEMASNHAAASRAAPKQQQAPRRPSPPPPPPPGPSKRVIVRSTVKEQASWHGGLL